MSLAMLIKPHIAYLRRFARALSGSQSSGDAYVQATIETLLSDPASFDDVLEARTALFKVFIKIWNSVDVNQSSENDDGSNASLAALDQRLAKITHLPRQAFLLVHVEDFSDHQAATALDINDNELAELLDQASAEMAQQVSTRVLIIEDEPLIALDIEEIVSSLGHSCIGIARTKDEALTIARRSKPGLVLADIQLADGSSGIDVVNLLLAEFAVPVIFITAYPERLLTGERPEPTFLIPKPFQPATLTAIICQALFFEQTAALKQAS